MQPFRFNANARPNVVRIRYHNPPDMLSTVTRIKTTEAESGTYHSKFPELGKRVCAPDLNCRSRQPCGACLGTGGGKGRGISIFMTPLPAVPDPP